MKQRQLTWVEVALLVRRAGFRPGEPAMRMTAICEEESRRAQLLDDTTPVAEPDGSVSYGIAQCNSIHLRAGGVLEGWDPERLHRDHLYNLEAAFVISKDGTSFSPWTTFRDGLEPVNVKLAAVAIDAAARIIAGQDANRLLVASRNDAHARMAAAIAQRDIALSKMSAARDHVDDARAALT